MEALYIRLEYPPKGNNHAHSVAGRAAARNWDKLRAFADEMGVKPLDAFIEQSPESDKWHQPADALRVLQRLHSHITAHRKTLDNPRMLIRDLGSYENILFAAQARGSRFRFTTTPPEK